MLSVGGGPGGGMILYLAIKNPNEKRKDKNEKLRNFYLSHLQRKTLRIFSVNRIPNRCVLVLNSARRKSSTVGVVCELPIADNIQPPRKPKNEFVLVLTDIG